MRRIPFPTESGTSDTSVGTLERLLNLYPEPLPAAARTPMVLRPTPGLDIAYNQGLSDPIRAMSDELPGYIYYVQGFMVYRLNADGTINTLGPISFPDMGDFGLGSGPFAYLFPWLVNDQLQRYSSMVTVACGALHTVIVDPPNAFGIKHSSQAVHQIVGSDDSPFPGASSVAYINGYFVFTAADGDARFFSAKLLDPDNFDAFDFAYADAVPNVIRLVRSHEDRLWFFGDRAIEVWILTGDADFPFRRDSGGLIEAGVRDPRSVAKCDGALFFVDKEGMVRRTTGYRTERVSTAAIERRIEMYAPTRITGMGHAERGHQLYTITLEKPADPGLTLVYDAQTKRWHDRSSGGDGHGQGRWRPNHAAFEVSRNRWIMGDGDGLLLTPVTGLDTDAKPFGGTPQTLARMAILPPLWNSSRRMFLDRLEVEFEPKTPKTLSVDYTDDDGATWLPARALPTDGVRAVATRLGSAYQRTLAIHATGSPVLYEVLAQVRGADV